jgi:hypothetical protein
VGSYAYEFAPSYFGNPAASADLTAVLDPLGDIDEQHDIYVVMLLRTDRIPAKTSAQGLAALPGACSEPRKPRSSLTEESIVSPRTPQKSLLPQAVPGPYGSDMKTTAIMVEGRLLAWLEETRPQEQNLSAYVRGLLERALRREQAGGYAGEARRIRQAKR